MFWILIQQRVSEAPSCFFFTRPFPRFFLLLETFVDQRSRKSFHTVLFFNLFSLTGFLRIILYPQYLPFSIRFLFFLSRCQSRVGYPKFSYYREFELFDYVGHSLFWRARLSRRKKKQNRRKIWRGLKKIVLLNI